MQIRQRLVLQLVVKAARSQSGLSGFESAPRTVGKVCAWCKVLQTRTWPKHQLARELNSFLADSDYLSVMPEQGDFIPLPTGQPYSCPAATGSWWPRREINLRSTCPWTWEELDNGPDAYPRYIRQAKCMCQKCIDSTINRCQEIRQDVTIFRLTGCQDGLAVMQKSEVTVTLGCFCAAPEPNTRADDQRVNSPSME
ncbi:hypothetical protein EGW08_013096 [Elysia chlorotica]|uniref:Uncharacterized protein n=1 Tax=Elysia chlorotica TaxID=188477 RepID=A0A433TC59_ELYCH|nr:hypothetical protein EGW08_013096 [Elysia chlorotica]